MTLQKLNTRLSLRHLVGTAVLFAGTAVHGQTGQVTVPAESIPDGASSVWVYPNDTDALPQSFSAADWLIGAAPSAPGVQLSGEQGASYALDVSDYRLILVNQGDGALSPMGGAPLLGPVFSLSGLMAAEPTDLGKAVNVQIGPRAGAVDSSLRVTVQAQRPMAESAVIELNVRVLCAPFAITAPVSTDPVDFDNNGGCVAQSTGRTGASFAARELILLENQHYRVDAMARVVGGDYGSVVSKRFQISGAAPLATRDGDGDGVPDLVELELGLDFEDGNLAYDTDGDGWSELDEWIRCEETDRSLCPAVPLDTDKDGWSDYDEDNFRQTRKDDFIEVTDANGQRQTVARPFGSEPTAERLYEVEYRIGGVFYEQQDQQVQSANLADLSVLDIYGRPLFDQQALPHHVTAPIAKAGVPLEADLAPWNQASRYATDLQNGELPVFGADSDPVLRIAAGLPAFLRVQQAVADDPARRSRLVWVRWLDGVPDPTPADSGCEANPDAPEGAAQNWLACYRLFLKGALIVDLGGLNFGPEDAVDVALLGGLLAWATPDADPDAYFLPGSRQNPPDADAAVRLSQLMPATLGDRRFTELHERLGQMAQPFGVLDSLARGIEAAAKNFAFYLKTDPEPNTTQSHAADVVRGATSDELFAMRLAVVTDALEFRGANFDSQTDQDGDGVNGFDELADSRQATNPTRADSDGDGLNDGQDPCPLNDRQSCLVAATDDRDRDGVVDGLDNCPQVANPGQEDTASHPQFNGGKGNDGVGDACSESALAFIVKPGASIQVPAGQPVNFLARVTERARGDLALVNLKWEFGAGVPEATVADPTRTFHSPGIVTIKLSADLDGLSSTDQLDIEVIGDATQSGVVSGADLAVSEADGTVQLPLSLSLPLGSPVSVRVQSESGSATSGADFQAVDTVVQFAAGEQQALLALVINNDADQETVESFAVKLDIDSGPAVIGRSAVQVSIADNDLAANRDPVTAVDSAILLEDAAPLDIDVLANDVDPDSDPLTLSALGTASVPGAGSFSIVGNQVHYEPAADFFADPVTLEYTVTDGAGGSATGTLTLTVKPVNDAPSFTIGPNLTVSSDADPVTETAWLTALSTGPANESDQALSIGVSVDDASLFAVQPAINANGDLNFTPATDASGTAIVTVTLSDDGGTTNGGVDSAAAQNATIKLVPFENVISDPAVVDGNRGFGFYSTTARLGLGTFVSASPDINGDGCDEILVGSNESISSVPVASGYVLFGADTDSDGTSGCTPDLAASAAISDINGRVGAGIGYWLSNIPSRDFGVMVMSGLDVTEGGAGTPDILVASPYNDRASLSDPYLGVVVLLKGEALAQADTFNGTPEDGEIRINDLLASTNPSSVAYIFYNDSANTEMQLGQSVAGIGDVNADGKDDFAIVSISNDGNYTARVYVIFGGAANLALLDANDNSTDGRIGLAGGLGGAGFVIEALAINSGLSQNNAYPIVSAAGDLNDDGIDDLIVNLPRATVDGNANAGQVAVVYGGPGISGDGFLSVSDLDGAIGFRIESTIANSWLGRSLASAGDIDGDGVDDMAFNSLNEFNNSELVAVYGGVDLQSWPSVLDDGAINPSDVDATTGYRIEKSSDLINFGLGLAFRGLPGAPSDLLMPSDGNNGRGGYLDRLVGGADNLNAFDLAFTRTGEVDPGGIASMRMFDGRFGFRLRADTINVEIGNLPQAVAGQFDFNGDGVADMLIGEPGHSRTDESGTLLSGAGRIFILLGD